MLIVDMPMPKNCGECPISNGFKIPCPYGVDDGAGHDMFQAYKVGKRPSWCPIKGELVRCGECRYPLKKETPVGTVKYDCVLHKGWYDADHYCGHGERHGERKDLHELTRTYTRANERNDNEKELKGETK